MKAFRFRLEQVLHWREQNVRVEQARLAESAAKVAAIRAAREESEKQATVAAHDLTVAGSDVFFQSYEGFRKASRKQAAALLQQEQAAQAEYASRMALVVEASRKARLLERLHAADRRKWQRDADREIAEFAGEAFLMRHAALQRVEARSIAASEIVPADGTIERRTGA